MTYICTKTYICTWRIFVHRYWDITVTATRTDPSFVSTFLPSDSRARFFSSFFSSFFQYLSSCRLALCIFNGCIRMYFKGKLSCMYSEEKLYWIMSLGRTYTGTYIYWRCALFYVLDREYMCMWYVSFRCKYTGDVLFLFVVYMHVPATHRTFVFGRVHMSSIFAYDAHFVEKMCHCVYVCACACVNVRVHVCVYA